MSSNWTCPYCHHDQAVTSDQSDVNNIAIRNDKSAYGPVSAHIKTIRCANEECKQLSLSFALCHRIDSPYDSGNWRVGTLIQSWQLLPESAAKPQPSYIPDPLVESYEEACRIRDLSPKASATLSRRCLQGMIRDFCNIQEKTLLKEIEVLRQLVDSGEGPQHVLPDTVNAIDAVRSVGNIGAHMGEDINKIIDVEPTEAQALIELIELLFEEWYIRREHRKQKLDQLQSIAQEKKQGKEKSNDTDA